MSLIRVAALAAVCALAFPAEIPRSEYGARRAAMRKALGDAVMVLFGYTGAEMADRSGVLTQDPDFYYLTGWKQPGALLLLSPEHEVLFLPPHDPKRETYTGRRTAAGDQDAGTVTGFTEVLPMSQFEARFARELESHTRVLTHTGSPQAEPLKRIAPLREFADAAPEVAKLRVIKSPAEIAAIEHAVDVSLAAHRAAWQRMAPGLSEYQLAATMTYQMQDRGCEGNAYDPIVGSGRNATILHYSENSRRIDQGDLVLMDAAASCGAYAADITRTVPAGGKFTPRQRELYELVLGAQKAALAIVKPGMPFQQLTDVAREYLNTHGKDAAGVPLGKYLTHRISHGVGLEVHDYPAGSATEPLGENMVITIEPGLYLPDENIGIRIEDVVLVTAKGARLLSSALPREAGEIEKAMAK